jgi:hypothetical protein
MKTGRLLFLALTILAVSLGASAQGVVNFNNLINGSLRAPIYDIEPSDYTILKQGNSPTGLPAGLTIYNGAPLAGAGYTAELWGGPASAQDYQLQPLARTVFRTGSTAGYVVAVPQVVVPTVAPGGQVRLQVRAWNNLGGTVSSWAAAYCNSWRGSSTSFLITLPLSGVANLNGLMSFNLQAPLTPDFMYQVSWTPNTLQFVHQRIGGLTNTVLAGESIVISVFSTMLTVPPFNWTRNGTNIPGATATQLALPSVGLEDAGTYGIEDGNPDNCFGSFSFYLAVVEPRLNQPGFDPGGSLRVRLDAAPNRKFVLESSSNLKAWTPVQTQQLTSASAWFTNTPPLPADRRFYRAVLQSSP